jgi:hypothetical protein
MAANLLLYSGEPLFDFETQNDVDRWHLEGGGVVKSRYTSDATHTSVMSVTSDTDGKGVWYEVTGLTASTICVFDMIYYCASGQEIDVLIYDQTNGATIDSTTLTSTSWDYYHTEVTTPSACVTVRIYLRAGTSAGTAFYVDNVLFSENALAKDAEDYDLSFPDITRDHTMQDGTRVIDRVGRFLRASLRFANLSHTETQRLLAFAESDGTAYFDDQACIPMVETITLYTETEYTYSGITNPSSTHVGYYDSDEDLPAAAADFQTTEMSTANYGAIDGDDSNYAETSLSGDSNNKKFVYHKFKFDITEYTSADDIYNIQIIYKGAGLDNSRNGAHGLVMYVWDGTTWWELDESVASDKQTFTLSLSEPEHAQKFVDVTNDYILILVRTRAQKSSGGDLILRTYYVEAAINDGKETTISLTNKCIPDSGDVTYIKETGACWTLDGYTLGDAMLLGAASGDRTLLVSTDYSLNETRDEIDLVASGAGKTFEIKYDQHYHVRVNNALPNTRMNRSTVTTPKTETMTITLEGVVSLEGQR